MDDVDTLRSDEDCDDAANEAEQMRGGGRQDAHVRRVLDSFGGSTFAEDAGIALRDKPSPLWQLAVLVSLLSARIDSGIAVRSARELLTAGWRTPTRMAASTWQQRVDALGRGGYRRFDERASSQLGELAEQVQREWRGDLRRLHEVGDDVPELVARLTDLVGIGPAGASIFLREVQVVWTDLVPYVDDLAREGAEALDLPGDADELLRLVPADRFGHLVAACVRAARSDDPLTMLG